jgi:hypothetical protein
MTDTELTAETEAALIALIAALKAGDKAAEAVARERMRAAEIETLTRQIAALKAPPKSRAPEGAKPPVTPKPAPPPRRTAYDTFCDQCERCQHHWPCAYAKNSTLKCPGPKYRGFTFTPMDEAA